MISKKDLIGFENVLNYIEKRNIKMTFSYDTFCLCRYVCNEIGEGLKLERIEHHEIKALLKEIEGELNLK